MELDRPEGITSFMVGDGSLAPGTPAFERALTILLVEDEVLIRLVVADELRARGFQVIEACSGEEAITVLQSNASIQVLFTDVQLPGVTNGFELGRRARQARPGLKVIAASGNSSMESGGNWIDAFFDKPYSVEVIVARIHGLFGVLS